MTFLETLDQLTEKQKTKILLIAVNTLLLQKEVYSAEELETCFIEAAKSSVEK